MRVCPYDLYQRQRVQVAAAGGEVGVERVDREAEEDHQHDVRPLDEPMTHDEHRADEHGQAHKQVAQRLRLIIALVA
jgi:hypothetical protein